MIRRILVAMALLLGFTGCSTQGVTEEPKEKQTHEEPSLQSCLDATVSDLDKLSSLKEEVESSCVKLLSALDKAIEVVLQPTDVPPTTRQFADIFMESCGYGHRVASAHDSFMKEWSKYDEHRNATFSEFDMLQQRILEVANNQPDLAKKYERLADLVSLRHERFRSEQTTIAPYSEPLTALRDIKPTLELFRATSLALDVADSPDSSDIPYASFHSDLVKFGNELKKLKTKTVELQRVLGASSDSTSQ